MSLRSPERPDTRSRAALTFVCAAALLLTSLPTAATAAAPSDEEMERLRALGYVDSAPADNPDVRGVTMRMPTAGAGVNLYTSRNSATAKLVDLNGEVLHSWSDTRERSWMHVELQENGDLYAVAKDRWLVKLDWDSKVLWRHKTRAHHDVTLGPDGLVYVISRDEILHEVRGKELPFLADKIDVLTAEGELVRSIPLLPLLLDLVPRSRLADLRGEVAKGTSADKLAYPEELGDATHTNSVAILERRIRGVAPAGSLLLSVRELDRVVIINAAGTKVLWSWGKNELQQQHHATQVRNGNIMVFDNGTRRGRSRVLEVNPRKNRIVWSFSGENFFTLFRGSAQKLANGNVLATLSDSGHALEVDRSGNVIWEFWNPVISTGDKPERDAIYRVIRYPRSHAKAFMATRNEGRRDVDTQ